MRKHRVYGPKTTMPFSARPRGVRRDWIQRRPFPYSVLPWSSPSSAPEHSDYEPESDDDIMPIQLVHAVTGLVRQSFTNPTRIRGTRRVVR